MDSAFIEILMAALILAYVAMGGVFVVSQRQGRTFIASFDKAIAWGIGLFVIGCFTDTLAYAAWA